MKHLRRIGVVAASSLVLGLLGATPAGCASDMRIGTFTDSDAGSRDLVASDGSVSPTTADAPSTSRQCVSTECPAGRVTCPNNPFPCSVDLSSDDENCGACGVRCPNDDEFAKRFHGVMRCVRSACRFVCATPYQDCNGLTEDGCETALDKGDPDNCGACGNVCPEGICSNGNCGCPTGQTLCPDGKCHNLDKENNNCGACGNVCPTMPSPYPPSTRITLTCVAGKCNVPTCPNPAFVDCNHDVAFLPNGDLVPGSDGCETYGFDNNNCGSCGNKCAPGEECVFGTCRCRCGAVCDKSINEDPDNCGTCGLTCPGVSNSTLLAALGVDSTHGRRTCDQGLCGYSCSPNWGNCDGDIENGCETNFLSDPLNCGGCGIRCDVASGQPCVGGRCLTKDCEVVQ